MNNNNTNIPAVSVSTMVSELGELYVSAINSGMALKAIPSVFLWGAPGVGKSDGVRQMADRISAGTGKTVKVIDIRLLLFSPIDLRGVPMADESREFTRWLRPKLFDLDSSEDTINILRSRSTGLSENTNCRTIRLLWPREIAQRTEASRSAFLTLWQIV